MAAGVGKEDVYSSVKKLVKCDKDGNTDWKTLGNIQTKSLLEEVDHASLADHKYGQKSRKKGGPRPDTEWKFDYEKNNVMIFKKHQQNNITSFMGRGIIGLPVLEVAEIIHEAESYINWNTFMTESTIVKVLSASDTQRDMVAYFCHENTQCFVRTKRDFALFMHSEYIESDGKYIQAGISIEHPDCPLVEGITRAEACLGSGWVLEPYGDDGQRTLATYSMNIDFKGPLPAVIMNRVLRRQPLTLNNMRTHIMKLKKPQTSMKVAKSSVVEASHNFEEEEHDLVSAAAIEATMNNSSESGFLFQSSKHFEEPLAVADFTGI